MVPVAAEPVRVFAVDDHPAYLVTVGMVVGATPGFDLVGTATSAAAALEALAGSAPQVDPDLILVDVVMPDGNGSDFVRRYRERGGQAAIILMSSYEPDDLPSDVVGPSGLRQPEFMAKNELLPDLLTTIWRRVAANESPSGR